MKSKIVFFTLFVTALITYSCTKKDSLPSAPVQTRPDTTVQTIPPTPVEAIVSSDWLTIDAWSKKSSGNQNFILGTISAPGLSDKILNEGVVLIFLHNNNDNSITAIPDNVNDEQNFIESNNYIFTSLRAAGSLFIAVLSASAPQLYPSTAAVSSLTEYRYFLIPKSRLKQGLDYKDYNAVCNFYEIKK